MLGLTLGLATMDIAGQGPDFSPGVQIPVSVDGVPMSFDLERSYGNFVTYLAKKLGPDELALMVELNLIEVMCPTRVQGLYQLYRDLYDRVRSELGPQPRLFATLSYPVLLGYAFESCYPAATFGSCALPPPDPGASAGPAACYPASSSTLAALSAGSRLDVLALSFYPDSLDMDAAGAGQARTEVYSLDAWNAAQACLAHEAWPVPEDPLAALDALGWSGPVVINEAGRHSRVPARSSSAWSRSPGTVPPRRRILLAFSTSHELLTAKECEEAGRGRRDRAGLGHVVRRPAPVGVRTTDGPRRQPT